jgi:F0F1-type ATP synthase assembly protein I
MRLQREQILGCGLVIQLTITVVVAAFLPLLLGIWLDRQLHTSPFITLFLVVFGIILGTVAVYRQVSETYGRVAGGKK